MRPLPLYGILEIERQVRPMRCPDCGEAMNEGFLKSNQLLYFSPTREGSRMEYPAFDLNDGGFKDRFFYGSSLPAHYCPCCHLILARRPDPDRSSDFDQVKASVKRTIQKLKKEDF